MELAIHADVPLNTREKGYQGWQEISQYLVWAKEFGKDEPQLTVLEMTPQGVVSFETDRPFLLHRVPAGRPMHVNHLFGFWHTSDADRLWIHAKYPNSHHYTMISGGNLGTNSLSVVSWFCPKCANELVRFEDPNPDLGPDFWDKAAEHVKEFNNSLEMRTCKQCGHVHPHGYAFLPEEGTEGARERLQW